MSLFKKKNDDGYVSYSSYKRKTSRFGRLVSKASSAGKSVSKKTGSGLWKASKKVGSAGKNVANASYKAATSDKAKKGYKKAGKSIDNWISNGNKKPLTKKKKVSAKAIRKKTYRRTKRHDQHKKRGGNDGLSFGGFTTEFR